MSYSLQRFLLPAALVCCTAVAAAQGVDNPLGVFQLEGNTSKDNTICFLPVASGGPAIATPGTYPTGPGTTTPPNSCPTVDQSGNPATWQLVTFGATTDDWASFAFGGGKFTSKSNAIFVPAYVADGSNSQSDTAFLGASSKDTQDITQWNWTTSKPQAKDDIVNAFATAYKLANGHTAVYFGMDRLDGSGDATGGFWFVQDSTFAMCTGNGTDTKGANPSCTAAGTFVGKHFDGDLLIVSDFSNGGTVSTINVFQWSNGQLVLSETRSPAPCDIQLDNSSLCGVVNNAFTQVLNNRGNPVLSAITVSPGGWPFGDKSGSSTYLTGEFLEGAVDLNAIFGANIPCFSTFFAETRSSTSANATLSDVTPPVSFPLCSLTVTKACTGSSIVNGNQIQYNFNGSVLNTGSSTLYSPVVYDTPPSSIVGSLTLNQPTGPIAAGQSAQYTGSFVSSAVLSSTDKNLVSGAASSNTSGTPLNVVCGANPPTSTDKCADWGDPTASSCAPTITTGLTLTKACKSCLVGGTDVHVAVSEAFKVCNTSNVNVSGITVLDCRGTISGSPGSQTCSAGSFVTIGSNISLNAATDATHPTCMNLSGSYTPTVAAASYSDQAIASGTAALGGGTIYANAGTPAQASCPVCPIATDCPTNPPVAACPTGLVCP